MRVWQMCWVVWAGGMVFIVMSWLGIVPNEVGWLGFAICLVAAAASYLPQKQDPSQYPLTREGLPVEPSDIPVTPETPLAPGTPLLAYSQGKWWRATVVAVEPDGLVLVAFPGWDPHLRDRFPRKLLQIDPDPMRAPMRLPPEGWLDRKSAPANPHGVKPSEQEDGIRRDAEEPQ
jgi:hypothetical protein